VLLVSQPRVEVLRVFWSTKHLLKLMLEGVAMERVVPTAAAI
jgi:hypothetical protein